MVRKTSDLEANIVAVERTKEYAELANEVWPIMVVNSGWQVTMF